MFWQKEKALKQLKNATNEAEEARANFKLEVAENWLKAVEKYIKGGEKVLDIGTGSGILPRCMTP